MSVTAKPLTAEAFASFGTVLSPADGAVKTIRDGGVRLTRTGAPLDHDAEADQPAIDLYEVTPDAAPLKAKRVERHPHSVQLFSPMTAVRWLVAIWPDGPYAPPVAFVATPEQAVLYGPGVWHHGIVALDRPALFLSWMWRTGTEADTEFADLPMPVSLTWPAA